MIAGPYYLAWFTDEAEVPGSVATSLLVLALLVACIRSLRERNTANRIETIAATVGGLLYIPYLLHYLVRILMRDADSGENLTLCLWVVAVAKFCDVGALLTGLAIGRHKMAPEISPKKTWEGFVGAVVGSVAVALLIHAVGPVFRHGWPEAVAFGAVFSVVGILGDLAESMVKRDGQMKDASARIPGFGGALDVVDSVLLAAPVAYLWFATTYQTP